MMPLGLLAILQITFLPGFLIWRRFRLEDFRISAVVFIFGLSLLANYCAALILATFHILNTFTVIGAFCCEFILLIFVERKKLILPIGTRINALQKGLVQQFDLFYQGLREKLFNPENGGITQTLLQILTFISVVLALTAITWILRVFMDNLGTVFNSWDAVGSWNRWSVEWAQSVFPASTRHYPQLLPLNLSLTYLFLGTTQIQFFAKAIMPLFTLAIFVLMLDLAWQNRSLAFLVGLVFAQLMLKKFFGEFITESYADIPVAFMATASVYCLIRAEKISDRARVEKILWLGSILSAGCAVTKQTGLYLMAIYPLLSLLILKNHTEMTLREKIKLIGLQFAVAVLIVAPWYIYKEIAIWQGFDENEIVALTNIPQQQRWIDRLIPSMLALGKYISLYLLIFVMGIFSNRFYKALIYGVIIPFTLIWALMFSYDTRNVALVVPLVCICSGVSLELMYQKGMLFFSRIKVGRIPTLMVIAVVFGGLLGGALLLVSNGQLIGHQVELQKKIFATSLDDKIYQYLDTNPGNFKVISQYPVNSLPGLENSMTPFPFGDYGVFQALVNNPEYNYILLPGSANPQIQEYVDQQLSAKKYALIFEDQNNYGQYSLIKIR